MVSDSFRAYPSESLLDLSGHPAIGHYPTHPLTLRPTNLCMRLYIMGGLIVVRQHIGFV